MSVADATSVPPILVLGLGNRLLRDDGVGLELLRRLDADGAGDVRVEVLDGGTQGLALLGRIACREAILVLDAVGLGAEPGTVHHMWGVPQRVASAVPTAHEGNAAELFAAAALLGELPPAVRVVGIEPAEVRTGIGLSAPVLAALPAAAAAARAALCALREALLETEPPSCTS